MADLASLTFNQLQLQLYTAKSQYWLHKAGAKDVHGQLKTYTFNYNIFNKNIKWLI